MNSVFFQKVKSLIAVHRDNAVFDHYQYQVKSDRNGLLYVKRLSPKNKIIYISNETDKPQEITDYNEILIENRFSKGTLLPHGFIICQK